MIDMIGIPHPIVIVGDELTTPVTVVNEGDGVTALAVDIKGGALTRPHDVVTSGNISALGGTFSVDLDGYQSCAWVISGTWIGTIVLEASSDGTTWIQSSFHTPEGMLPQLGIAIPTILPTITANGTYKTNTTGGVKKLRLRTSAYTSGPIAISCIVSESIDMFRLTQSSIVQNIILSVNNSTTANIAAGSQFIGAADLTQGVASIQLSFICDQRCKIDIQQSMDGTNWDISDTIYVPQNEFRARPYTSTTLYTRIIVTNQGGQATSYLRLQTLLCPIDSTLPRTLTDAGNLKVSLEEKNPHTAEGSIDKWHVQDIEARQLLEEILEELKTMNLYFEIMTDENIRDYDITNSN